MAVTVSTAIVRKPIRNAAGAAEHAARDQLRPTAAGLREIGRLNDWAATAELLGTSPRMVRRLWATRQLIATKVGKHVRFSDAEIARFITDNTGSAR